MTAIIYTAKRNIISGHVVDASYSMDVKSRAINPGYNNKVNRHESIGGNVETIFHNEKETWNVTLGSFPRTGGEGSCEQMREFLSSVQAGEVFSFDAYGTIAQPDNVQTVYLKDRGYKPQRIGFSDRFIYNLNFVVQ